MTKATERARSLVPSTRETSGRAITARRTNSPSADITARNAVQRATSSEGVAALSVRAGIANSGAGPGFGPIWNVNAPRTGCPSAEMTRQKTRYQPSARCFTGTSSVYASLAERCGAPAVCAAPAAFVIETIANRGSTTSSNVRVTVFGCRSRRALASGNVFSSAACAHAAAGAASAAAAIPATTRALTLT